MINHRGLFFIRRTVRHHQVSFSDQQTYLVPLCNPDDSVKKQEFGKRQEKQEVSINRKASKRFKPEIHRADFGMSLTGQVYTQL